MWVGHGSLSEMDCFTHFKKVTFCDDRAATELIERRGLAQIKQVINRRPLEQKQQLRERLRAECD
jgi:hypothetical protein